MLGSDVGFFAEVFFEIVEGKLSVGGDAFPVVDADGAELAPAPEEVVVFLLFLSEKKRGEGDAVAFFPRGDAGEFARGGQPIPEGGSVIADPWFYGAGPVGDHGDADAAIVE